MSPATKAALKSCVVVNRAPELNYRTDYVALPADYGSAQYYQRQDIQNIIATVNSNLKILDRQTGFTAQLRERRVLIKPNLVTVYHNAGFIDPDYPNTTDPRVLDAVVAFIREYTDEIVIVESSGRGMPTRGSFRLAGIDRLAERYGAELIALEEEPVDCYYLPRGKVMQHVLAPRIFREVFSGEAFYISLPKMKTNLYTQVTLGFKNSMGCIPYNLRQKNHNYDLDQKLVDMLWLFRPDLVIIDGIIGAQGQCPAPVEPVDSHVLISGTNSVETDRVATRIMGFDPDSVKLMQLAAQAGFGDSNTEVIGEIPSFAFKPADPSLLSSGFRSLFPNVKVFVGHQHVHSPVITGPQNLDAATLAAMEKSCRGGCLATTRLGFEFLHYEGLDRNFALLILLGRGVMLDGKPWYFDVDGRAWSLEQIRRLPGRKLCVGDCSASAAAGLDASSISGCMVFPNSVHMRLHTLTRSRCRLVSPLAPAAPMLLRATWKMRRKRMFMLKQGLHLDFPLAFTPSAPELLGQTGDFVPLTLPPLSRAEIRGLVYNEWREIIDLFIY